MRAIDKEGERADGGKGREKERERARREGGGIKRYLHMEIPEKKLRLGEERWMHGWMEGWIEASLTDLLTKTQGGTLVTLTQQHICVFEATGFSTNEVSSTAVSAAHRQWSTVKFRAGVP